MDLELEETIERYINIMKNGGKVSIGAKNKKW